MPYQKLLTKEVLDNIPPLYAQEKVKDPIVWVKFFTPWTNFTWYATEYDPKTRTFFGWVEGQDSELGYFDLDKMESIRGPGGLKIERDSHFHPKPLSMIKAGKSFDSYDLTPEERQSGHKTGSKRLKVKHNSGKPSGLGGMQQ